MLEMGSRLANHGYLDEANAILSEIGARWDVEQTRKAMEKS